VLVTKTLRLPTRVKVQIAREAGKQGKTVEHWIQDAVERELERRKRFRDYIKEAQRSGISVVSVEEDDAKNRVRLLLRDIETSGRRKGLRRRVVRRVR
jgi:hypothetical protein